MNAASLPSLWAVCVERLKDRVNNRGFWEALELAHPITIQNDQLVLGLDSANFARASHLQQGAHANAVQRAIEEVFQRPLGFRVIEGTSAADWEYVQQREARVAVMRQTTTTQRIAEDKQAESWDGVYEQIARLYQETAFRALPQGKARYANEALYVLMDAMDQLYPEPASDVAERNLARILDRIANASEIPAAVLAFELERLRAWRRSADGSAEADTESTVEATAATGQ